MYLRDGLYFHFIDASMGIEETGLHNTEVSLAFFYCNLPEKISICVTFFLSFKTDDTLRGNNE